MAGLRILASGGTRYDRSREFFLSESVITCIYHAVGSIAVSHRIVLRSGCGDRCDRVTTPHSWDQLDCGGANCGSVLNAAVVTLLQNLKLFS